MLKNISIYSEEHEELKVGDIINTTTSTFNFDNLTGKFCKNPIFIGKCICKHVGKDYSNFETAKCSDGGAYGFDEWEIIEVL